MRASRLRFAQRSAVLLMMVVCGTPINAYASSNSSLQSTEIYPAIRHEAADGLHTFIKEEPTPSDTEGVESHSETLYRRSVAETTQLKAETTQLKEEESMELKEEESMEHDPGEFTEAPAGSSEGDGEAERTRTRRTTPTEKEQAQVRRLRQVLEGLQRHACECVKGNPKWCGGCRKVCRPQRGVTFKCRGSYPLWLCHSSKPPRYRSFNVKKWGCREAFRRAIQAKIGYLDPDSLRTRSPSATPIYCVHPAPWHKRRSLCPACSAGQPHGNKFIDSEGSGVAKVEGTGTEGCKQAIRCSGWRVEWLQDHDTRRSESFHGTNANATYHAANRLIEHLATRVCNHGCGQGVNCRNEQVTKLFTWASRCNAARTKAVPDDPSNVAHRSSVTTQG